MVSVAQLQRGIKKMAETAIKDQDQGDQDQGDQGSRNQEINGYVDIMDFVNRHPSTVYAIDNWNIWPQALTNAVKDKGGVLVLKAIAETRRYKAAKNPAGFFWSKLKELSAGFDE